MSNNLFSTLETIPKEFAHLKYKALYYAGNLELLNKRKITILGSRNPNPYAQNFTQTLARRLSCLDFVVVSGGALGIDIIAHTNALPNTIMVSPASLDIIYPKSNAAIINKIYQQSLVLSPFESPHTPHKFSFLERNKFVVSLGECVIIPQADLTSGSMQSANYALKRNKKIFVPPHHINHSKGTQTLAKEGKAQVIWDIDDFIALLNPIQKPLQTSDTILEFCAKNPFFEEAFLRFGEILFEYELEGKIRRNKGRIEVL